MSIAALPKEILDKIVDHIAEVPDDVYPSKKPLKAVALSARCFLHRCQSHLFRDISIPTTGIPTSLLDVLETKPGLLKHVRKLVVWLNVTSQPLAQQRALLRIAEHLEGLERLLLISSNHKGDCSWNYLGAVRQTAITKMFEEQPLVHLTLCGILDIPFRPVASLPHLQTVHLTQAATFSGVEELAVQWKLVSLRCNQLAYQALPALLSLNAPAVGNSLVYLQLQVPTLEGHKAAWKILLCAGDSPLEFLRIEYARTYELNTNILSQSLNEVILRNYTLPTYSCLRYIDIQLYSIGDNSATNVGGGGALSSPSYIPRFLHKMLGQNPQPALVALQIHTDWITNGDPTSQLAHVTLIDRDRGWGLVDDTLSDSKLFPCLQAVRVRSEMTLNPPPEAEITGTTAADVKTKIRLETSSALYKTGEAVKAFDVGYEGGDRMFDAIAKPLLATEKKFIRI
ncbi:hypothetical protein DFP72DRAFT_434429 [Ephemerocybe angulata]|uniref:Uncharacterized protein n=1 Tax=Ephemerocybe angulata TaxID=980116 RepID=A0A8H6HTN3_9AGAR|nr:hypothetical protein DFP72DRAFT_434429 [Tulosesus angulatus]